MGTELHFSIAFHPQTYGQSERVIQVLEDMLRACMLDFKETGVTICRWYNLRITIAIRQVLGWHLMRHCMEGHVDHRHVG